MALDIAQISHLYRPSIGGIENYVHRLNGSARAAGHSVTTYTTDLSLDGEDPPADGEGAGPDEGASPDGGGYGEVRYCNTDLAPYRNPLSRELYRRVRASDHDVYHLHNPWFLAVLEGAHAAPTDAATVITVHSAEIRSHSPLIRALNLLYRPLAGSIMKRVDHSFVLGETERTRLLDRFDLAPSSVSVVPNAIYPEEYDVPDDRIEAFRASHDLDPGVPTVLYVSRLIDEKNPDVFVEAVASRLADRDLQALVVGTGDPDYVRSLRRRAGDRVRFLPNLEFEALKAAYHAADLFVFLGTWEGLPTVILEAMNARLPVITTPVGGIGDAVADGENGVHVPSPPDPSAVAGAIARYLDRPDRRRAVGEHNRAYVREEYHWDDVADRILQTYEELAGREEKYTGIARDDGK